MKLKKTYQMMNTSKTVIIGLLLGALLTPSALPAQAAKGCARDSKGQCTVAASFAFSKGTVIRIVTKNQLRVGYSYFETKWRGHYGLAVPPSDHRYSHYPVWKMANSKAAPIHGFGLGKAIWWSVWKG